MAGNPGRIKRTAGEVFVKVCVFVREKGRKGLAMLARRGGESEHEERA
jgi:hypothetical protein